MSEIRYIAAILILFFGYLVGRLAGDAMLRGAQAPLNKVGVMIMWAIWVCTIVIGAICASPNGVIYLRAFFV